MAGKRIKKLRRNWSLKKDDITKGLSKIKKSSKTLIEDVYNNREGIKENLKVLIFSTKIQLQSNSALLVDGKFHYPNFYQLITKN